MTVKRTRIHRNVGRIEFIACRKIILTMKERGYDAKKIHARLRKQGRITMSYSTMCYHLARHLEREAQEKAEAMAQHNLANVTAAMSLLAPRQRGFGVNKTPQAGEMI